MSAQNIIDLIDAGFVVAPTVQFSADTIVGQIPIQAWDLADRERPSDVRVILKTAKLGVTSSFINHGHPDNEMSCVDFNGENAVIIMPSGCTPLAQIFAAKQITDFFRKYCPHGLTPEFIDRYISNPAGFLHRFSAQIYGPTSFEDQIERFVPSQVRLQNGDSEHIQPDIQGFYASGMRAPTTEKAFLVKFRLNAEDIAQVSGTDAAAAQADIQGPDLLQAIYKKAPSTLIGTTTAAEQLEPILERAIVLAVGSDGKTKPIRLSTARQIFDVDNLVEISVDPKGRVVRADVPVPLTPKPV